MTEMPARLDRYTTGDLPIDEERALARAALEDPHLFDELMTAGATRAALDREGTQAGVLGAAGAAAPLRGFWRAPVRAAAFALAAALLIFAVFYPRARNDGRAAPAQAATSPGSSHTGVVSGSLPAPVVLSARLEDFASSSSSSEFRSAHTVSRSPKTEGRVSLASQGADVVVPLGSLDGITQGTELQIVRGSSREPVGRLTITTVFREQSRGRVDPHARVKPGDVALVSSSVLVAALHQQMVALVAAGDITGAREAATRALPLLDQPGVAVEDTRGVLALAGAIERRAGQPADAVGHLRAAADVLSTPPAVPAPVRAAVLNELGAALLDGRRPDEAERVLAEAQQISSGSMTPRIENNRGAAAALRGDRTAAERWYRAALSGLTGSSASNDERRAIDRNLSNLTAVR